MSDESISKLAVLLHADVVGSTALVQIDESIAHRRIRDVFRRLSEAITAHAGISHEIRGDALIAEFSRASDAITAALEFQMANTQHNAGLEDEIRPQVRIGVAMGEVVIADNTVTGDGIVLAQRLEQLAEPGGLCIQGAVYETLPKRLPFDYQHLGEREIKGFSEPVRVYCVRQRSESGAITSHKAQEPKSTDKPSIAVLPFTNMSGDPEQEYFSDGITEDIITALSYVKAFPVIARNSTFTYKGQSIRVQQVAEELGARYVIEGSVRKAGNRIRTTAQLIDAQSGHHLWAEKYDHTLEDIFEVQDEITRKIVFTVQPQLTKFELERVAVKRPENLNAWDLVLRGTSIGSKHSNEDYQSAREIFQTAIDIDPGYTDAWAGLAWAYLANVLLVSPDERQELIDKGKEAAERAVDLDQGSSFAHFVLGTAYVWKERFDLGIKEAETALQLNPYNAQARMGLGNRQDLSGDFQNGIDNMKTGIELSPRDPRCAMMMAFLARAYLSQNHPDEALEWIERAINSKPHSADMQYRYAICLAYLDRVEDARNALAMCDQHDSDYIATRNHWRPYSDSLRNRHFFSGIARHKLLPESYYETGD